MISVLYVDDEPDLLELAQIFLEQSGKFTVRTSTSAQEMLDSLEIPSFDLIISDYQMPGMDGIAFLKAVRERFSDLPFILFTGRGREEVAIEALNNGADFYIQKGGEAKAQFAELANKIQYAVSRKRAEKELLRKNDELNASFEQIAANEEKLRQQLDELTGKQEALKNSEEKFRAFTENIPDLTTIADATGRYTYISPSIQRITGRNADEVLGEGFTGIEAVFGILPEDAEMVRKSGRAALQRPGETIPVSPFRVRDFKGDTVYIEGSNTYLPGVKGIQGLIFHGRDISDRVRAEEALQRKNEELSASFEQITASDEELRAQYEELGLIGKQVRESEVKFREIFEKSHDALILFTKDGCTDCNLQALELYGYSSKEEFLGLMPGDVSPPFQPDGQESRVAAAARLRTVLEKGVDHFEWVQQRKDGSTFLADVLLSAFELDGMQVFLSSVRDVTERKRMEDELRLLKISVERSTDQVFWLDFTGLILYVNDAACRITGYSREELRSMKIFDLDPDFPPERWGQSIADLRQRKTQFFTTRHRHKDGTYIDVEIISVYVNKGDREYSFAFVRDISRRKQAEQVLAESEEKYRSLVELSPVAVVLHRDGKVVYASPEAVRLLKGQRAEDLIGRDVLPFIHPDDHPMALEHFRLMNEEGGTIPLQEERLIRLDGETITVEITAKPIQYQGLPSVLVAFRDITERKQAEQVLAESEERYRTLINSSFDGIAIHQDGIIVYVNPTAARLLGSDDPEYYIGKPAIDIIHPDDRPQIADRIRQSREKSLELLHEKFLRIDGTPLDVDVATTPCTWQGKPATYVTFRDISDRKLTENALCESEEKFRTLVESSSDFIWEVDEKGAYTYISPKIRDILGYDPQELIGKTPFDFMLPEETTRVAAEFNRYIEARQPFAALVNTNLHKNGSTVILETNGVPWFSKEGTFAGYRGIDRDITERKRAEEALYTSQQMLRIVLDTIPQRVFWKDKNSVFLGCNKPNALDAGFADPADMVGKTDYDYTSAGIADLYRADDRHVMETGEARVNYEEPQERSDGSRAWLRTSKVPLHDKEGQVIGVLGTYEDITERKLNEEALRESEEKYRTLVENASEAILIVQDWHIVFVNKSAVDLLGIPAGELKGRPFMDFILPNDREQIKTRHDVPEDGEYVPDAHDFRIIGAGGRPVWVLISTARISWQGKPAALNLMTDITERKFMEGALRESEETFRRVIEGAPEAIYIGAEWKFMYLNPAALRLFGAASGEQLLGTPFMDRIHPRFHDAIKDRVHQLYDELVPAPPLEEVYLRLDGTEIDVEVSSVPFNYLGKNGSLVFVWDITDRKRAEREIRESEEKYKRIFESFVDIYYETDKDGIIRVASPSVFAMSGWRPEELIGTSVLNLYENPEDRHALTGQLTRDAVVSSFETMLRKRDGTPMSVSINARVRYSASGEPDGIMGSIRDITENVRARRALQASEVKYRRILENLQDAYFRADAEGSLVMASPSAARMFGYDSPEEMIGMPLASLYESPEKRQDVLKKIQDGGKVADIAERMLHRDGTTFWVSLSIQALKCDDGRFTGTEGIVRDITERKVMEQAIQEANRKLGLLNSITRHDVANQLTVLQGYAQLAAIKNPDPLTADFFHKIDMTADTITRQIEFMKTYQEMGIQTPAWFRLDETIAKAGKAEVIFSNTCRPVEIFSDPMLERVFYNLFENAIRHGGHVTHIAVSCERAPDGLVIIVEDDGVGIAPEEKEKIFEKGFGKNTGFGLFLAREILALTGITIRETGYQGVGARFEITVPKEMWRIVVRE